MEVVSVNDELQSEPIKSVSIALQLGMVKTRKSTIEIQVQSHWAYTLHISGIDPVGNLEVEGSEEATWEVQSILH
jgi:hypothetical protein